ncbi:MAG: hypothetical protein ACRD2N_20405 [Vicinamibacterales bacterium]
MIVAVAALLFAACLSVGLRATSGWLDRCHPIDRLLLAIVLGGLLIAAALVVSTRFGVTQAGYGLAFSLAPVGLFDVVKWWYRSRRGPSPWLVGARAATWILALRWIAVLAAIAALGWLAVASR